MREIRTLWKICVVVVFVFQIAAGIVPAFEKGSGTSRVRRTGASERCNLAKCAAHK